MQVPVLIVQGTHDLQVPLAEADLLLKAQPAAQLVKIDGMNHVMKITPAGREEQMSSYTNPSLPLAPGVISAIADFINAARVSLPSRVHP